MFAHRGSAAAPVVITGETFAATFRSPLAWRELLDQIWFVARVSVVPTIVLSIPRTVQSMLFPAGH